MFSPLSTFEKYVLIFFVLLLDTLFGLQSLALATNAAMAMNADTIILFIVFDILCENNLYCAIKQFFVGINALTDRFVPVRQFQ